MSKYYTPKREEFYIGFEYENKGCLDDLWKTVKAEWSDLDIIYDNYEHEEDGKVEELYRVKYLDKSDIESFGFKLLKKKDVFSQLQFYKEVEAGFNCGYTLIIRISENYGNNAHYIEIEYNEFSHYQNNHYKIRPIIKNKSELKVILAQLRVLKDE